MVNNLDLTAKRGDTLVLRLTITENGVAVNITAWTFWLTIKTKETDADVSAVIQKKVTSHTDPTNGKTAIIASASETDVLLGKYFYDVQYKDDAGVIVTPVSGIINFTRDITRSIS